MFVLPGAAARSGGRWGRSIAGRWTAAGGAASAPDAKKPRLTGTFILVKRGYWCTPRDLNPEPSD